MANPFFDSGHQRAAKVQALFGLIAPRYDLINDIQSFGLHRYWKRRVIMLATPRPGEYALDICCGTGDITLALAQCGLRVVGLDFSEPMLAVARERASSVRLRPEPPPTYPELGETPSSAPGLPQFLQGNAEQLPFPDNTFDIVTVAYGLRNLTDWKRGLHEMLRVAKPGGRLLVLDFGNPDNALWRAIYQGYLRYFVPCLGRAFCGDAAAYSYILESLKHYPAQRGVAAAMSEMAIEKSQLINLLGGVMSINYGSKPGR